MMVRQTLLRPLAPIYGEIVSRRRLLFETGRLRTERLKAPVISIGSLSAGGAGKTPVVLLMADLLGRLGYAVRILSRGYGRESREIERVDPAGDARRYGDEPMLLARRSGAPVFVGADRYRAGLIAEAMPVEQTVVHLLDDGFQHYQLGRELDIVLLTRRDVGDVLLPAGNLREPLSTLRKAGVIVIREDEVEAVQALLPAVVGESGSQPAVWQIRRRLNMLTGSTAALPRRVLAFCGVARPESFASMLELEGCRPVRVVTFGDHQRYREREIAKLLERAKEAGADGFVTTEKDAVKLTEDMRRALGQVGPLAIARMEVELADEKTAINQVMAMVPGLDRRRVR